MVGVGGGGVGAVVGGGRACVCVCAHPSLKRGRAQCAELGRSEV